MRVIFETNRQRECNNSQPGVVVGIGSYAFYAIHVGAYVVNNGAWGVFGIEVEPHTCRDKACRVKIELLALGMALRYIPSFSSICVVPSRDTTLQTLIAIKEVGVTPQWDYAHLISDLDEQYNRLRMAKWTFGEPGQPAFTAQEMAQEVIKTISGRNAGEKPSEEVLDDCLQLIRKNLPFF